jgi:molybdate transport system substrate-binding protein
MSRRSLLALCFIVSACAARAAELRIIFPTALAPALDELAPRFEKATGHRVAIVHAGLGAIADRVGKGETFDVVVTARSQVEALAAKKLLVSGPGPTIATGAIGVGVRANFSAPPIDTPENFKAMLVGAKAIAYVDPATGSNVGAYLTGLFERLAIADALKGKTVLAKTAAELFDAVKGAKADYGLAQMSEIVHDPAMRLAGPLPDAIQSRTAFAGAIATASAQREAAKALIDFLEAAEARAEFTAKGLAP